MLHWTNSWNGLRPSFTCQGRASADFVPCWLDSSCLLAANVYFSQFPNFNYIIPCYGKVSTLLVRGSAL